MSRTNMRYFAGIAAALLAVSAGAQDFSAVLSQIENNNTTIKALRHETDAQKAETRVGLAPSDPTVSAAYLWGTGTDNKIDLEVMQEIEFPTVYYWRKKIADGQSSLAEMQYAQSRKAVLLEAKILCIDLAYYNALTRELQRRLDDAQTIMDTWQKRYDLGEASILDLNKAKLNLLTARKELEMTSVDREASRSELVRLNGGVQIDVTDDVIPAGFLPADFESWFESASEQSPELMAIRLEQSLAESSVKLATSEWMPKFNFGYVSEREAGAIKQGIGAGISIPLWENHGKVKAAKARAAASAARTEDAVSQYYNSRKNKYSRVLGLQKASAEYRDMLRGIDSSASLAKALQAGEISLADYVLENTVWYEALVETLQAERDCAALEAEMNAWQL